MSSKIKIGLLGCGTVGSGLVKILNNHKQVEIAKIFVRNEKRAKQIAKDLALDLAIFTWNIDDVLTDSSISIVVELMGGVDQTKKHLIKALENGKDIVTANKDLLALEGDDLFAAAEKYKRTIMYEAAVAGGIPIITTLKQSLAANKIICLQGILNGTTNYILDVMKKEGKPFAEVLMAAQELGFAEADPTNDIDGHDAAYKVAILASIISGKRVDVNKVYREGISKITKMDINSAQKRGYEIKLLGMIFNNEDKLDARVHPVFVPLDNPLASVGMENNAILVKGDASDTITLIGKGAGSLPTASSVAGDIMILISKESSEPNPLQISNFTEAAELKNIDEVENSFYIRISMHDKLGVLRDLGEALFRHNANVKFIDQYDVHGSEAHADFIIDPIQEKELRAIVKDLEAMDSIKAVESVIRVL
ncbi:MAG: homoserine dehydrogenase [Candidatus Melainabacteria bacterium]|jgi:homoserine dehydrogenase|nr:homoserine dehydrogenase [Candidatus Melainabacteria bacterium]